MRSVKKLLLITLFLGLTLPALAQDETQSATDEAVSRPFAESAVAERHSPGIIGRHRGRKRHRGNHGGRGQPRGPVYTPAPPPPPPAPPAPPVLFPINGTYNITYTVIVTCPYIPITTRSGSITWTFVSGVLVGGGGVTVGTIDSLGNVNVTSTVAGYYLNFSGSFHTVGNTAYGDGKLAAGGVPYCGIGGGWTGVRQ
jgi:hypothetical protein